MSEVENEVVDPFELASGIEYDAEIKDAYFGFDAAYNEGETLCLVLELETDDGTERKQLYPCGDKWETTDGGKTIQAINPKKKNRVNTQSGLGLLVSYAIALDGVKELLLGAAVDKTQPNLEAGIWKGLNFTFAAVEFSGKVNGKDRKWNRTLPTEFLGGEGAVAGEPAVKLSKDQVIEAAIREVATSSDTFTTFMERAIVEVDGVEGSDWEQIINDETYYDLLRVAPVAEGSEG